MHCLCLHLIHSAQCGGVVVEVVSVDSEFGAQLHKHISNTLLHPPLLQPSLQIRLKHPVNTQQQSEPHDDMITTALNVWVPVEIQYEGHRAEDDLDVCTAKDGSVGVQSGCKRLLVHIHNGVQSVQIKTLAVVQLSHNSTSPI